MIAPRKPACRPDRNPAWHAEFLKLLPCIQRYARYAFRSLPRETRDDLIQEVVANCLVAFVRLVALGKSDIAYPTPLAMFAVRQVRAGRRVGANLNVHDVSSPYAQQAKGIRLERLDQYDRTADEWREIVVEDKRATPADVARVRIDFTDWLHALPPRRRKIAQRLALGETTGAVAKRYDVSAGRISQLRRELADAWRAFQDELPPPENTVRDSE